MNLDQLKEIIRLFEGSSLTALDVQVEGERCRLRRDPVGEARPVIQQADAAPARTHPLPAGEGHDFNRIIEVKSPVVGIFYEAPEPGGKPFVQVGDLVKKGDVLCLIEVMKQVTEVSAPQDGQVADICMASGSVVEFGQTLIKLY
ncbi:MAG: acetyl-CoA carboxylase, biotin carboxyl carrier protein [Clostridiales bacterium]|jgi:acetyl-CoA carboxylase biotin carboxyl carrier protein|nr:acetyl-CoA carboxylase, biotin carboxyl carrier protein [Clostridiales bacterium]